MIPTTVRVREKALYLTETEANDLLEMCLLAQREVESDREPLIERVAEICREFLRQPHRAAGATPLMPRRVLRPSRLDRHEPVIPDWGVPV